MISHGKKLFYNFKKISNFPVSNDPLPVFKSHLTVSKYSVNSQDLQTTQRSYPYTSWTIYPQMTWKQKTGIKYTIFL